MGVSGKSPVGRCTAYRVDRVWATDVVYPRDFRFGNVEIRDLVAGDLRVGSIRRPVAKVFA